MTQAASTPLLLFALLLLRLPSVFTLRALLPFPVFGVRKEARNERLNQRVTRGFAPSFSRDGGFAFGRSCPYRR